MINLKNITKIYGKNGMETKALDKVDLTVEKGESVAIVGKSGCGKTTLLNILGAMDKQSEGRYLFEDMAVSDFNGKQSAQFRNKKIGFIFQHFNLISEYTALENIEMPMGYGKKKGRERRKRALELLKLVGLEGYANKKPGQMSGGQCQRVAIARALANNPEVILADEPTGALDSENAKYIMNLLLCINQEGTTLILVTHDNSLAQMCKRMVVLEDGKIIKQEVQKDEMK